MFRLFGILILFFSLNSSADSISIRHPLVAAIDRDQASFVEKWLHLGNSTLTQIESTPRENLIQRAVTRGSLQVFAALVSTVARRAPKEKLADKRGTPLMVSLAALSLGNNERALLYEKMLQVLIEKMPLTVNEVDRAYIGDGRTALHQAAANGNLRLVKFLIAHRAEKNAKNSSGETPLHHACRSGKIEVVRYLLQVKAKVNEPTKFTHGTPLMAAAEMGHADVIRLLMASGARKEVKDIFGKTAPDRYREFASTTHMRGASASGKR